MFLLMLKPYLRCADKYYLERTSRMNLYVGRVGAYINLVIEVFFRALPYQYLSYVSDGLVSFTFVFDVLKSNMYIHYYCSMYSILQINTMKNIFIKGNKLIV